MSQDWEQLSSRVQAVTGKPLPPPGSAGSPEFDSLMAELRAKDPALWQEVLDAATGAPALPVEREARQEQARQRVLSTLLAPFFRPDGLRTGGRRLNATAVLVFAGAVLLFVSMLTQTARRPPAEGAGTSGRPTAGLQQAPRQAPASPAPTLQTPPPPQQGPSQPAPGATPGPAASGVQQAGVLPLPAPALPPAAPDALPPAPPGPAGVAAGPSSQQMPEQPASPVLYRSREDPASKEAKSAVLYRAAHTEAQQPGSLSFKAQQPESGREQPAMLFRAARDRQQEGQEGAAQSAQPAPQQQDAPKAALHVGQVFRARLSLPVSVSPAWGPVPALAEVADGPLAGALLWGQARMARDGSVEITFTQVITEGGRSAPFNGLAYDEAAGKPALSAQVRTVMPAAAQTLLSSTLQAASEYFKSRVESRTVTITNGFVTIRQGEPDFWDVYSRSLAQAMTPQTPAGSGPVVVAHLPKGTVISVIAMSEFTGSGR